MWLHDADRKPFPIAPDLHTFLAAVGIFAEVDHGKHKHRVFVGDSKLIPEVEADLDRALAPLLAPEYRQYWIKPV